MVAFQHPLRGRESLSGATPQGCQTSTAADAIGPVSKQPAGHRIMVSLLWVHFPVVVVLAKADGWAVLSAAECGRRRPSHNSAAPRALSIVCLLRANHGPPTASGRRRGRLRGHTKKHTRRLGRFRASPTRTEHSVSWWIRRGTPALGKSSSPPVGQAPSLRQPHPWLWSASTANHLQAACEQTSMYKPTCCDAVCRHSPPRLSSSEVSSTIRACASPPCSIETVLFGQQAGSEMP